MSALELLTFCNLWRLARALYCLSMAGKRLNGYQKQLLAESISHTGNPNANWWDKLWQGMPEFISNDLSPWRTYLFHFEKQEDIDAFALLVNQKIGGRTKYIWYPEAEDQKLSNLRWVSTIK